MYRRAQLKHLVGLLLLHMGFAACFPLQAVTLPLSLVVPVGYPDNPCCVPAGLAKHLVSLLLLNMGFAACFPLQAVTLPLSLVVPVGYPDNPCCVPAGPAEAPGEPGPPSYGIRCLLPPSGSHSTLLNVNKNPFCITISLYNPLSTTTHSVHIENPAQRPPRTTP